MTDDEHVLHVRVWIERGIESRVVCVDAMQCDAIRYDATRCDVCTLLRTLYAFPDAHVYVSVFVPSYGSSVSTSWDSWASLWPVRKKSSRGHGDEHVHREGQVHGEMERRAGGDAVSHYR